MSGVMTVSDDPVSIAKASGVLSSRPQSRAVTTIKSALRSNRVTFTQSETPGHGRAR